MEPRKMTWAESFSNGDFISVETYSGRGMTGRDPEGSQHLLEPDANDEALGIALLDAMARSRFLTLEENRTFFDHDVGTRRHSEWVDVLLRRYGYKTTRSLFENMMRCSCRTQDNQIIIRPTHHQQLEGWGRERGDGIEDVVIPGDCSPTAVGAGLRLAFSRCTGLR